MRSRPAPGELPPPLQAPTYSDEQGSSRSHSRGGHGHPSLLPSLPHLCQELFTAEIGFKVNFWRAAG